MGITSCRGWALISAGALQAVWHIRVLHACLLNHIVLHVVSSLCIHIGCIGSAPA